MTPLSPEAVEWITDTIAMDVSRAYQAHQDWPDSGLLEEAHEQAVKYQAEWLRHAESLRAKGGANGS